MNSPNTDLTNPSIQTGEYEYMAFISYKREDEKWARWLQRKLEHYKLPSIVRKENAELPKKIRPIFRDTTDLSGGLLEQAILQGLTRSKYLIVICSPRAASSPWVCKEVQTFVDMGKGNMIIPFIVEGIARAHDANVECFPEALLRLSGQRELLGININENGRDAAAVKVVANMFNLKFDTLWRRYQREAKRVFMAWIVIATVVMMSVVGFSVVLQQKNVALKSANVQMLTNEARAVSEKVLQLIDKGDLYSAVTLALHVLADETTGSNLERPYCAEAERSLRKAIKALSQPGYKAVSVCKGKGEGDIENSIFSPDDKWIFFSESGDFFLHDVQTGKEWQLEGHAINILELRFNNDGSKACAMHYRGFFIWEVVTKRQLLEVSVPEGSYKMVADADSSFATDEDYSDTEYPANLFMNADTIPALSFVPDSVILRLHPTADLSDGYGKYNHRGGMFLYDATLYADVQWDTSPLEPLVYPDIERWQSGSFSPDASTIALGDEQGNLWFHRRKGEENERYNFQGSIREVKFSNDGQQLLINLNDSLFMMYQTSPFKHLFSKNDDDSECNILWNTAGDEIAYFCWQNENDSTITKYLNRANAITGKVKARIPIMGSDSGGKICFSDDDSRIYGLIEGDSIIEWNINSGKVRKAQGANNTTSGNINEYISQVFYLEKQKHILLVAGQGRHRMIDAENLMELYSFQQVNYTDYEMTHVQEYVHTAQLCKDDSELITITCGGTIRLYDVKSGLLKQTIQIPFTLPNDTSGDILLFATISKDGTQVAYSYNGCGKLCVLQIPQLSNLYQDSFKRLQGRTLNRWERKWYYLE